VVKALDRVGARGHASERAVHLRHVLEIERDVPLRQLRRAEAELAPGEAIPDDRALAFEMVEIGTGVRANSVSPTPSLRLNQMW
jgi:hypothetical protein